MSDRQYDEVLKRLRSVVHVIDTKPRDTADFMHASDEFDELLFRDMTIREFHFITRNLGHKITDEEVTKLIVAASEHKDLSEVLPINVDAKLAFKFKNLRQRQKMTQEQVAEITGNYTQSQIAKAEAVDLPLTLTRWSELFRAIGQKVTIQIG